MFFNPNQKNKIINHFNFNILRNYIIFFKTYIYLYFLKLKKKKYFAEIN